MSSYTENKFLFLSHIVRCELLLCIFSIIVFIIQTHRDIHVLLFNVLQLLAWKIPVHFGVCEIPLYLWNNSHVGIFVCSIVVDVISFIWRVFLLHNSYDDFDRLHVLILFNMVFIIIDVMLLITFSDRWKSKNTYKSI